MKIRYPADITIENGKFKIVFTDFSDCYAMGDTMKEAIKNAKRNLSYQMLLYQQGKMQPPNPSTPRFNQITIMSETVDSTKELPLLVNDEKRSEKKRDSAMNTIKLILFTIIGFPAYSFGTLFASIQLMLISFFAVIQFIYVVDDLLSVNAEKDKWTSLFFDCLLLLEIVTLTILCVVI